MRRVVEMIPVGRKGRDFFKRRDVVLKDEYIGLTGSVRCSSGRLDIARRIIRLLPKTLRSIKSFSSTRIQNRVVATAPIEQILPIPRVDRVEDGEDSGPEAEYIYEQPAAEILENFFRSRSRLSSTNRCSSRLRLSRVHV
jgi:F-type H+-transporting ATPase subunit gamma